MKYINQNRIFLFSLMRGGTHPVINWISKQFNEPQTIYPLINIPSPENKDKWKPFIKLMNKQKELLVIKCHHDYDITYYHKTLGPLLKIKPKQKWGVPRNFNKSEEHLIGSSKNKLCVIILRDIFNHFASRLRGTVFKSYFIDLWKKNAREFTNKTNYLENKVPILFNDWFISREYRKTISSLLGGKFSDEGIETMTTNGGGSAFDKRRWKINAQKMQVNNRWEYLTSEEQSILLSILDEDDELRELAEITSPDEYEKWY